MATLSAMTTDCAKVDKQMPKDAKNPATKSTIVAQHPWDVNPLDSCLPSPRRSALSNALLKKSSTGPKDPQQVELPWALSAARNTAKPLLSLAFDEPLLSLRTLDSSKDPIFNENFDSELDSLQDAILLPGTADVDGQPTTRLQEADRKLSWDPFLAKDSANSSLSSSFPEIKSLSSQNLALIDKSNTTSTNLNRSLADSKLLKQQQRSLTIDIAKPVKPSSIKSKNSFDFSSLPSDRGMPYMPLSPLGPTIWSVSKEEELQLAYSMNLSRTHNHRQSQSNSVCYSRQVTVNEAFSYSSSILEQTQQEMDDSLGSRSVANQEFEEWEDGCPVIKAPRAFFNGLQGVMSIPRRQWKKHCQDESDSRHFMVMSYNLLAPHYCTPEKYPKTNQEFLDWDYRRRKILDEIAYYSADFICLQELPSAEFTTFLGELQTLGYHGYYQKKKREHAPDGCAIFYKTSRFALLDVQAFAYNERIPDTMAPDLSARLSNFSNVALIGVFQNIHARSLKVRVVTTHLHWDPAFSDIKLLQASLLIDWLESTNALIPTVIAGDLNSKPGEPVVDYLVRGKVCLSRTASSKSMDGTRLSPETQPVSENTGASSNNIPDLVDLMSVSEIESEEAKSQMNSFVTQRQGVKLASAYNCRDLPYTNKTPDFEGVIDHILYSSGTLSIRDVLCDVYLPSQSSHEGISSLTNEIAQPYQEAESQFPTPTAGSQITQYGLSSYLSRVESLPNRHFPSDHVSLCALLKWKTVPILTNIGKSSAKKSNSNPKDQRVLSQSVPSSSSGPWMSYMESRVRKPPRKSSLSKDATEIDLGSLSLDSGKVSSGQKQSPSASQVNKTTTGARKPRSNTLTNIYTNNTGTL